MSIEIKYIGHDGVETVVQARVGDSVMETAVDNGVEGIIGECGGAMACATCHCFIDEAWSAKIGPPGDHEDAVLDGTMTDRQDVSRLGCQVRLTESMNGLVIHVPEAQIA